jgi:hypothetical protein
LKFEAGLSVGRIQGTGDRKEQGFKVQREKTVQSSEFRVQRRAQPVIAIMREFFFEPQCWILDLFYNPKPETRN